MAGMLQQDAEVADARVTAQKALEASTDPCKAKCVELECLLQAKDTHIAHLEAEKEAQARSHRVRLTELQESCHNKVRQLQQLHREQLLAAQSTSAAALAVAAAPAASTVVTEEIQALNALFEAELAKSANRCSTLQEKLLTAEQHQEGLRQQLLSCTRQLQSLQQQEQHSQQALARSTATQAELVSSQAILQERCTSLQAQVVELQQKNTGSTDSAAVFQVLESQLVSLSRLVKQRDEQVVALQQTVQQQCDERTMMQVKFMQLNCAKEGNAMLPSPVTNIEQKSSSSIVARPKDMPVDTHTSTAPSSCTSSRILSDAKVDRASQRKERLNRLASASEQQQGKSGLLGRIMATSSMTGKTVFD